MSKSAAAVALLVIVPGMARAFQDPLLFDALPDPVRLGGGGVHFTGSPTSRSYHCEICHQNAQGLLKITWSASPSDLSTGNYQPGATYTITVNMVGEHLGLDHPTSNCSNLGTPGQPTCNWNGMAVEVTDVQGNPAGMLCPEQTNRNGTQLLCTSTQRANLSADGTMVFGVPSTYGGDTTWSFTWQAPNDLIPVVVYAAVVDGNGGGPVGGTAPHDGLAPDVDGDDVGTIVLNWGPASPMVATTCGYGGSVPLLVTALAMLPLRKRRRR